MTLPVDVPAAVAALSHDLTPWGMYLAADTVVKAVMLALAAASVATWTVLLAKGWALSRQSRALRAARALLLDAAHLPAADGAAGAVLGQGVAHALLDGARTELRLSGDGADAAGIKERIGSRLERIELAYARDMRSGVGVLASIGAIAPFVGLFGTVWGIMNSFIGIADANTTHLAVVAPGIAEALLATALGLVAAIPAVVIYNHFARVLAGLRALAGDVSAGVQQLVSRDLDRRGIAVAAR
ncbi:tonB-system energizer ExbB [Stenotrophomonas sp. NPDC101269]|uniref:tonB-system energizer ExbB n=1 Tax=Stenotrophomonas TaxID=40323 RepID=UPI0013135DAE|nr:MULTISPECIES: tonB-system energizer ExbB [Stenotrophomonas]